MNKRLFGIKISTILSVFLCLVFAIFFWLLVKYTEYDPSAIFRAVTVYGGMK
jgi:hypothetical protein